MPRFLLIALLVALAPGWAAAQVRYEAEIVGIEDKAVRKDADEVAQLKQLEDKPPATLAALRRRAEDDLEKLKNLVNGAGYWGASFYYEIDASRDPVKVTVRVDQGPLYTLDRVTFRLADGSVPPVLDGYHPVAFGLELGKAARSAPVVAAEPRIADAFAANGYPYGKVESRNVVVDHGTHTMAVVYTVAPGPLARFGPTSIEGLDRLERRYVERRIEWRSGELYNGREVEATRKALVDSGLFSSVRITPAAAPSPDGTVPMTLALSERLARSIGAGLNYNTSEGFGARASWEHRNLTGHADRLRVSADFAEQRLGLSNSYRRPDLFGKEQDLLLSADLARENPDAYDVRRLRFYSGAERRFGGTWTAGFGGAFEQENVSDAFGSRDFTLLSVPTYVRRDTTDSLLDPRAGSRSSLTLTPYGSVAGESLAFLTARATHSNYAQLDSNGRYVLATWSALGTIFGPGRDSLPADKRWFAGGGGSVRGYGFQRIGQIGPEDRPLGGKSALEGGVELRYMVTDSIGIVPFLEAGSVHESMAPTGRLQFGAGIGGRYFTPFGPVRLDVAFPLNPRSSDDIFQVYISLGQAF